MEHVTTLAAAIRAPVTGEPAGRRRGHVHRVRPDRHLVRPVRAPGRRHVRVLGIGRRGHVPSIHAPASTVGYALGAASILIGLLRAFVDQPLWAKRLSIGLVLLFFVVSLLCWAYAGSAIPLNVVDLLQGTMTSRSRWCSARWPAACASGPA